MSTRAPAPFRHLPALRPPERAGGEWTLAEDWVSPPIPSGRLQGWRVAVRAGLRTDGISIPRVAWRIVGHPFQVPLLGPALVHDGLYAAELARDHSEADWIMLEFMDRAGIGWVKRNAVYAAVRTFGGVAWWRHTRQSVVTSRQYVALLLPGVQSVIWPETIPGR